MSTSTPSALDAERQMDEIMGWILRVGVYLAAALVFVGGVIYVARHPERADYRSFHGTLPVYRTFTGIFHEAFRFSGRGLIQLGILVLIATPIARVVFSLVAFFRQRDWTYVGITLTVLALLLYSLLAPHT